MELTLEGIVTEWRDLQSLNAYFPMEVTLGGMVMEWRDLQSLNA